MPVPPALPRRPRPARRSRSAAAISACVGLLLALSALPASAAGPSPSPTSTPSPTPTPTPTAGPSALPSSPTPTPSPTTSPAPTTAAEPTPSRPSAATAATEGAGLSVEPLVNPQTLDHSGQSVTYSVTVTNGGQAVRDLSVAVASRNLHPLVCGPVAQGATLATGAGTVCTATRSAVPEDLTEHGGTVRATATGFAPDGSVVTASSSTGLRTATAAPVVTDDQVSVTRSTATVVLPATTNDSPAVPGAPSLDPGRTRLKSPYAGGTQLLRTFGDVWDVLPDGSVRYTVRPATPTKQAGFTDSIQYQTTDSVGRSRLGTLTVVVRDGLRAQADPVTIRQGGYAVTEVVANDRPGLQADGSAGAIDRYSLRFADPPIESSTRISNQGQTLVTPGTGRFEASDGQVYFYADGRFVGKATATYEVTDSLGNVGSAILTVTVTRVTPTVTDVTVVTPYLQMTVIDWYRHATSGASGVGVGFGGFLAGDGTNVGTDLTTAQGSWYFAVYSDLPSRPVTFYPAVGFSGVATVPFEVVDGNGTRAQATIRVTVRHGWSAQPDAARTTPGHDVTTDPLANDVPNQRADGAAGTFDLKRLAFSDSGQPGGSVVASNGKTITLPGRGSAWITNGMVTFRPQAGFTGFVGRLALDVYDDSSQGIVFPDDVLLDRLSVVVAGSGPAATDDSATTVAGSPVTLPGSTNDDPGMASQPLPTTFPSAGQPAGSAVSAGGAVLTVPGQGVWSLNASGTATFTPAAGFVDGTAPALYQVRGAGGTSATATLTVSVYPGPTAVPDVVSRPRDELHITTIDVIGNDVPGRGADGTVGTIDKTSVVFPLDGQPAGSVVSDGGRLLTVPLAGEPQADIYYADPATGLVDLRTRVPRLGALPRISYQVEDTVRDAAGATVHRTATTTLQVTYTGRDPVATDDLATTLKGRSVELAGVTNDVAGSGYLRTDGTPTFPSDQLASLPPGSRISFCCVDGGIASWSLVVPGEGDWSIDPYYGYVTFFPEQTFVGTTTPVRYHIDDSAAGSDEGTLSVTVLDTVPATLRADTATTRQGLAVSLRPLANDTPGHLTDDTVLPFDVDELRFAAPPAKGSIPSSSANKDLVVPGEGTYAIAYGTGVLSFRPDPTFRGTTSPVTLLEQGQTSKVQIEVVGVEPVAHDDTGRARAGTPVRVSVLANDTPGLTTRPLVPGSLRLRTSGLPSGASVSADGLVAALPGLGTYAVAGDGTITFRPLARPTGTTPAVTYEVSDVNGTTTSASLRIEVAS